MPYPSCDSARWARRWSWTGSGFGKIMKELSVRTRDDEDKVKTDRLDLEFVGGKLGGAER